MEDWKIVEARSGKGCGRLRRKPYQPPELEDLGRIVDVTLKSGQNIDVNQLTKPGMGGG
ncbi:MAG: lasso RiPP family leader peptide-containing protein [Deltaproteobacteria bacterium]|nr:lasso RiPP family leader peptide-containing protein [Deltaproteobacteria bacterium]